LIKFLGKILILVSIILFIGIYKKINIYFNGELVEVKVTEIPISCDISTKSLKPHFKFYFKNNTYSKNLKGDYCKNVNVNDVIKLKTNKDYSSFIYPDEKFAFQTVSAFILIIFGIFMTLKKRRRNL
jgi:hypothetical protein